MRDFYSTEAMVVDQGGAHVLKIEDRRSFDRALMRFGAGEMVEVLVQTLEQKRTSRQNRFFHGPVCNAFSELGYSAVEAKDMLALMFLPVEIKVPDGTVARVPGHTAGLSVKDFNAFLDQCIRLAAEQGLMIPDAAEWLQRKDRDDD